MSESHAEPDTDRIVYPHGRHGIECVDIIRSQDCRLDIHADVVKLC